MKGWIRRLLESVGWIPVTKLVRHLSADHPDLAALPAGLLHIVGGRDYQKWAYLKCPCGCGAPIMLSLTPARRPHWKVTADWLDRPTVVPSIWQTDGCFSHFFVRQGQIDWVEDTGMRPPPSNF
jgi:hypothetical protein